MRMCPALAAQGHSVTLHTPRGEPAQVDDFTYYGAPRSFEIVKHRRFQVRVAAALLYAAQTRAYFQRTTLPELFYARDIYSLAAVASLGVPFCLESHWRPKNAVQLRVERWLLGLPNCRKVVLISEALRDIYRELFPWFPPQKLVVAHDAADEQPTADPNAQRSGGRLQVGYVGSFFKGYGIELVPRLAELRSDFDFHVFGGDPDAVSAYRSANRQLSNLEFHGFVQPSQLAQAYAKLDVVLAPYQAGTPHIGWISPMKLFEYMSHAKPTVCSDFPVMREVLRHEQNALLVGADDEQAWCDALTRLVDPELRRRLATQALADLRASHTWAARARHVLQGL